jgi:hypothetical protein
MAGFGNRPAMLPDFTKASKVGRAVVRADA